MTNKKIISPTGKPLRIGLLLVDEFSLMSYASVAEPCRAANLIAGSEIFEVLNFAASGEQATSSNQLQIPSDGDILRSGDFDMVFVIAGGNPMDVLNAPVIPVLAELDRRGVILGGVSAGPLLLAHAKLMHGRRMTVHWEHMPTLAEISPALMIERSLYIVDRNRITCAGGIAPMDMMYSLIAKQHGTDFARKISDWFLHTEIRPSEGAQRSSLAERYGTINRPILDTIKLMLNHIGDPMPLSQLAAFSGVSARQLTRLFKKQIGQTSMAFYLRIRLEHARNLLANSSLTITEIALATGFGSSAHFSTAFRKQYHCPPSGCYKPGYPKQQELINNASDHLNPKTLQPTLQNHLQRRL